MLQLCRLAGIRTIAVASDDKKLELCKGFGATYTINYKTITNFSEKVAAYTDSKGVDIITDPVLASHFAENMKCLGMDCRWIIFGSLGGTKVKEANLVNLLLKRATIISSTLKSRDDIYKT